jgi:putative ABC transport system permease protein
LEALGTNMLTATAGKTFLGEGSELPEETVAKLRRMEGVESASSIATLPDLSIYRNSQIDPNRTAGLEVAVADQKLLSVTGAKIAQGAWMNNATASFPTVVLGATAAQRLGVVTPGSQVWLGNQYFTVIGILDPVDLLPELDTMAFMGDAAARAHTAYKGNPTSVFVRADEDSVTEVRSELPRNVSPQAPETVDVSRPSDALAAKNASDEAFTGLLVGLGSIALLVGGIGVANTMVISVLERRREVGLRRALGATRAHIRVQFLTEALLLSGLGGVFGAVLGAGVTTVFAISSGWPVVLPLEAVLFGIGATLVIGAAAGLYPAVRAARTPPTVALSS